MERIDVTTDSLSKYAVRPPVFVCNNTTKAGLAFSFGYLILRGGCFAAAKIGFGQHFAKPYLGRGARDDVSMAFLSFLLLLTLGAGLFGLIAYLLRHRMRRVAQVVGLLGLLVALFLVALWVVEVSGWERDGLYQQLLYGLEHEDIIRFLEEQEDHREQALVLVSQSAWALHHCAVQLPESRERSLARLRWMAQWLMDEERFPQWKQRNNWEQQAFFLSQAALILGHYQLATADETYAPAWSRVCQFLANGIQRSKYKHLASRPRDMALRPTDNAAALLALQLHDLYYDSELLHAPADDWDSYIAKELRYDSARFPCAGFTTTNRCRLAPVGTSFAWLNVYTTQLGREAARYYWRDFRHYYKESFGFLAAWIAEVPEDGMIPEFCDFSVQPLTCGQFATVFGLQAAAQRGDWLSYYQLNN
ncbi:MAG: hypothetical protein D6772_06430, partial [Bacteroidetes bacterium]